MAPLGENNTALCFGKPFGYPCTAIDDLDHSAGFCDNNMCVSMANADGGSLKGNQDSIKSYDYDGKSRVLWDES